MRESKAENSKALLAHGNSRTAGKLSLGPGQQQEGREQDGGRDRLQAQHGAWGGGTPAWNHWSPSPGQPPGTFWPWPWGNTLYFETDSQMQILMQL